MKFITYLIVIICIGLVLLTLRVRLSGHDAALWHRDPLDPALVAGPDWAFFCPEPGSRWAEGEPADLARLDAIATDWPRTKRLFGSVEEGRLTYLTRSRLIGYPDYTTVSRDPETGQICMLGRQRYGIRDLGVNASRVRAWAQAYTGSAEAPDLTRFPGPVLP